VDSRACLNAVESEKYLCPAKHQTLTDQSYRLSYRGCLGSYGKVDRLGDREQNEGMCKVYYENVSYLR
jgi:hypothetical protein